MEAFTSLSLDIRHLNSLQTALNNFEQHLENVNMASWTCAHCGTAAQPQKKNLITEYPKLLWIQLKRFATEYEAGSLIDARQQYLRHYVRCEEFIWIQHVQYRQVARIYHCGASLNRGHYFCICRHEHPGGNWWYFNDTTRRLERPADDADESSRVYMCFYERC